MEIKSNATTAPHSSPSCRGRAGSRHIPLPRPRRADGVVPDGVQGPRGPRPGHADRGSGAPPEELVESAAARLRSLILNNDPTLWRKFFNAVGFLHVAQAPPAVFDHLRGLKAEWAAIKPRDEGLRGGTVEAAGWFGRRSREPFLYPRRMAAVGGAGDGDVEWGEPELGRLPPAVAFVGMGVGVGVGFGDAALRRDRTGFWIVMQDVEGNEFCVI